MIAQNAAMSDRQLSSEIDSGPDRAWIIAPVREGHPLADDVEATAPQRMFATLAY